MAYGNNNDKADNMDLSRTNRVPGLMKKKRASQHDAHWHDCSLSK